MSRLQNQESKNLSNKLWRAAKRIGSAAKSKRRFGCGEKIRNRLVRRKNAEAENFRSDKIAETELARITMVEIVVLVRDLRLACVMRMVAMLFGKLGENVLERMHRLEQYRSQYRHQKRNIQKGKFSFHSNGEVRARIKKPVLF